jgi:hypothetical protein
MEESGFILGNNGAEKCRQKYANLQNRYFLHLKHLKTTGEERKEEPPYFSLMHSIIGEKAKAKPVCIIDTESQNCDDGHEFQANNSDADSEINEDTVPEPVQPPEQVRTQIKNNRFQCKIVVTQNIFYLT